MIIEPTSSMLLPSVLEDLIVMTESFGTERDELVSKTTIWYQGSQFPSHIHAHTGLQECPGDRCQNITCGVFREPTNSNGDQYRHYGRVVEERSA